MNNPTNDLLLRISRQALELGHECQLANLTALGPYFNQMSISIDTAISKNDSEMVSQCLEAILSNFHEMVQRMHTQYQDAQTVKNSFDSTRSSLSFESLRSSNMFLFQPWRRKRDTFVLNKNKSASEPFLPIPKSNDSSKRQSRIGNPFANMKLAMAAKKPQKHEYQVPLLESKIDDLTNNSGILTPPIESVGDSALQLDKAPKLELRHLTPENESPLKILLAQSNIETLFENPQITESKDSFVADRKESKTARFVTDRPLIEVESSVGSEQECETMQDLYGSFIGNHQVLSGIQVKQVELSKESKKPKVYISEEAESCVASMVDTCAQVSVVNAEEKDLVIALYNFSARSSKEMSLNTGDVIQVRKRQGTWIYGTKVNKRHQKRQGLATNQVIGWAPAAFVTKYSIH